MKTIFIDTNKYLDLFCYKDTKDSLALLDLVIKLVNDKKIRIILPNQVQEEFDRNKEKVFLEFDKNAQNISSVCSPDIPFLDKDKIKKINKQVAEVKAEYNKKLLEFRNLTTEKIEVLFGLCTKLEETEDIINKGHLRTIKRNPPGKGSDSFGDAIIWESLLENCSDSDIIIISRDIDFASRINNREINPYLKKEWHSKEQKNIKLYVSIVEFINFVFPRHRKIGAEIIKQEREASILSRSVINGGFVSGQIAVPLMSGSVFSASANTFPVSGILSSQKKCKICGKIYLDESVRFAASVYLYDVCPDCSASGGFSVSANGGYTILS